MDAGQTFRLRKRTIAVLLLVTALLAMVLPLRSKTGMLHIYITAAERIVRGEEIYRPDDAEAFTYPPFFVLPAVPLLPLSPIARAGAWWFVNLCLLESIVLVIAHMVWPTIAAERENGDISDSCEAPSGPIRRIRDVPVFPHVPRWILPLLIAALAGRFMVSPLEYQSHDLIVFALIVLAGYAMARRRDAWAGTWAGLAAACKATPLIFLPLFCWQRRYSAAACFLAALIAATLAPDLLFPPPNGRPWVVHWYETFISKIHADAPAQAAGAWSSWNLLNQSLSATIYRLTAPAVPPGEKCNVCLLPLTDVVRQRLTLALELLVVGWWAWCTWPRRKSAAGLEPGLAALTEVGVTICAMLVLSPMSSSQHFGALLAPIAACATYWLYVRRDRFVAGVMLLVFLFGALAARDLLTLVGHNLLGRYACWPQAVGCKTWIALALFLACGHILRTAARGTRAAGSAAATLDPRPQLGS